MTVFKLVEVQTVTELDQIRQLFREYYQFLAHDHGLEYPIRISKLSWQPCQESLLHRAAR